MKKLAVPKAFGAPGSRCDLVARHVRAQRVALGAVLPVAGVGAVVIPAVVTVRAVVTAVVVPAGAVVAVPVVAPVGVPPVVAVVPVPAVVVTAVGPVVSPAVVVVIPVAPVGVLLAALLLPGRLLPGLGVLLLVGLLTRLGLVLVTGLLAGLRILGAVAGLRVLGVLAGLRVLAGVRIAGLRIAGPRVLPGLLVGGAALLLFGPGRAVAPALVLLAGRRLVRLAGRSERGPRCGEQQERGHNRRQQPAGERAMRPSSALRQGSHLVSMEAGDPEPGRTPKSVNAPLPNEPDQNAPFFTVCTVNEPSKIGSNGRLLHFSCVELASCAIAAISSSVRLLPRSRCPGEGVGPMGPGSAAPVRVPALT